MYTRLELDRHFLSFQKLIQKVQSDRSNITSDGSHVTSDGGPYAAKRKLLFFSTWSIIGRTQALIIAAVSKEFDLRRVSNVVLNRKG